MNELTVFNSSEFGAIRTKTINGEPWFVGKDVAEALGYAKPLNAITTHIDEDDSLKRGLMDSLGRTQETILINESGLYTLVLSSKLPTAKKFKRWVTSEVLPSIRQNGGYINNQEDLTPEQIVANALVVAQNIINNQKLELEQQKQKIALDAPLVDFANQVASSADCIDMGTMAKLLQDKGLFNGGRNKLFKLLRGKGILMENNTPYQQYMQYFKVTESPVTTPYGVLLQKTTTVNGKGQIYLTQKLMRECKQ